jgi:hypothetical protein
MFRTCAFASPDRNRRLSANVCLSCRGFAVCALWAQHPHILGHSRPKNPIRHARPFFFMSLFKRALSKKKECLSGKRKGTVAAQRILPVMGLGGPCVRRRFGTSRCCHAFQGKQGRMGAVATGGHVLFTGRGGSAASERAVGTGKMPPCRPLAIPSPARARIAIPLHGSAHDPNACTRKHWRMQTHHLVLLACCEGVGVLVRVRTRTTACALGAHS